MTLGLRAVLLIVAVILFVIGALSDEGQADLIAFGLACVAGALLVEELGLGRGRFGLRRRR
jgi:hypothetical protein